MVYVGDKPWDKLKDSEKISYCEDLLTEAKETRRKRDMEWYINDRFLEGDHYVVYNTVTSSIQRLPKKTGEVRLTINKTRSTIRAIQNYSTRQKPKWDVVPGDTDDDTERTARDVGRVMDYIYRKLHLEQIVSGVVESGLKTSVGFVEVDWDKDAADGLGQVRITLHDPFDMWLDKRARMDEGKYRGRFMAKTINKSLSEIKYDSRYNKKNRMDVKPDSEMAVSDVKSKILQRELGTTGDGKIKGANVKEFLLWCDEKNSKGGRIHLFTYAGGQVLRDEPLKDRDYPIFVFQIPMDPLKIYHRSWVADAIPLNKALNRSMSQKIMFMNKSLVYRIVAEKGHGVSVISNEDGEVVEINKNREFKVMDAPSYPATADSLTNQLSVFMEDILGAHDAATGRLPTGARSGKIVEALQAADANNLSNITQALESFLAVLGEKILQVIADKYTTSRIIEIAEPEEKQSKYGKVIGEGASEEVKDKEEMIVIGKENELIVKIGSWLGHTVEAQRETLLELLKYKAIPAEEVLRQFEFPNVEELSAKAKDERLEQHQMDLAVAGHAGEQAGQGQPGAQGQQGPNPMDEKMKALADKENMGMMLGQQLPPTEGATPIHTQAHLDFVNSQTYQQNKSEQTNQIFAQHIQGELQMQGQGGQQQGQPLPPQQPMMQQ